MMQLPAQRPAQTAISDVTCPPTNLYVIYTRAPLESQHVVAAVALVSAGSRKVVDENTVCGMMRLDALSWGLSISRTLSGLTRGTSRKEFSFEARARFDPSFQDFPAEPV